MLAVSFALFVAGCTADNPDYQADIGLSPSPDLSIKASDLSAPVDFATPPDAPLPDQSIVGGDDLSYSECACQPQGDSSTIADDLAVPYDLENAACGVLNKPCCGGNCLAPGTVCVGGGNGVCLACGNANQPCCANQQCAMGSIA